MRAAIYTRISDDSEGKGLGVERQAQGLPGAMPAPEVAA